MKKLLLIFIIAAAIEILPQQASTLFQIMNSNSLIDRPEIYRELQYNLSEEMEKQGFGLKTLDLNEIIKNWRDKITSSIKSTNLFFDTTKLKTDSTLTFKIEIDRQLNKSLSLDLKTKLSSTTPKLLLSEIKDTVKIYLDTELNNLTAKVENKLTQSKFKNAFFNAIITKIDDKVDLKEGENLSSKLAELLTDRLMDKIYELTSGIRLNIIDSTGLNIDSFNIGIKQINSKIEESKNNLTDFITNKLDEAEYKLSNILKETSDFLLNSNVGVAVTEGEGNLGGGFHGLFKCGPNLQIGTYFNGQFNTAAETDSSRDVIGLFGGQGRWAYKSFQLDVMLGMTSTKVETPKFESGLGLSYKISDNFILGFGGFLLHDSFKLLNASTFGFTFKGASPESVSLLLGVNKVRGNNADPIFQISHPISLIK